MAGGGGGVIFFMNSVPGVFPFRVMLIIMPSASRGGRYYFSKG